MVADDLVFGVQPRGGAAYAIRPKRNDNLAYEEALWILDERTTDVPTPLVYQGRLYILNGARGILMCVDPASGKELWRGEIGAKDLTMGSVAA